MNMTPKEIVTYLDDYVIGQNDAKKTIALALRNRYRRMQLPLEIQNDILPKNILMIGSTGVGKTEIARRLAKMMNLPFIKVEASKYTEVGFVGRDVESMVRDLVLNAINIVTEEHKTSSADEIDLYIHNKILDVLLPPLGKMVSPNKQEDYKKTRKIMHEKLLKGILDERIIEIEIPKKSHEMHDMNMPIEIISVQENIGKILGAKPELVKKEVSIKEAKKLLKSDASDKILDKENINSIAIERAQNSGIIFLDEIDKIAVSSSGRSEPSKEGVQRDLLPIVEGSTVNTKYGQIQTDHILFIAAGAFHVSKPSDLIPELQGRFPLRVELNSMTEETLYKILTQTKSSLLRQYKALLSVENVNLEFDDSAIKAFAKLANRANEITEDIGARRLHTVIENVIEDISFNADEYNNQTVIIDSKLVHKKLDDLVENEDLSRYIL